MIPPYHIQKMDLLGPFFVSSFIFFIVGKLIYLPFIIVILKRGYCMNKLMQLHSLLNLKKVELHLNQHAFLKAGLTSDDTKKLKRVEAQLLQEIAVLQEEILKEHLFL